MGVAKGGVGVIIIARIIDHNHSCNCNSPKNIKRKVTLIHIVLLNCLCGNVQQFMYNNGEKQFGDYNLWSSNSVIARYEAIF